MLNTSNPNEFNAAATYLRIIMDAEWSVYLKGHGCLLSKDDRFILKINAVSDTTYEYKLYIHINDKKMVVSVLVWNQFGFTYKMSDYEKYLNKDMKQQLKNIAIDFYKERIRSSMLSIDSCFQDIAERKELIAVYTHKLQNPEPGRNDSIIRKFLPRWKEGIGSSIYMMGVFRNDIHWLEARIDLLKLANN